MRGVSVCMNSGEARQLFDRNVHSKIRRTKGERWGFALPPPVLLLRCAPNGAARKLTF